MSTVTMEIPKKQAEQIEKLAAQANLSVEDFVALALQVCSIGFALTLSPSGAGGPMTANDLVEALKRFNTTAPAYSSEQFMSELAAANNAGDLVAATAARAKARAASIGFNSNVGQQFGDGVTYQNEIRDAW